MNILKVGDKAPEFELPSHLGDNISLGSYSGTWLIVAFYPEDNSMVCSKELCSYNKYLSDFKNLHAQVLGINTNSVASHRRFAEAQKITFPLLSDQGGTVSKKYNVLYPLINKCKRAVYIVNPHGFIHYIYIETTPLSYRKPKELLAQLGRL